MRGGAGAARGGEDTPRMKEISGHGAPTGNRWAGVSGLDCLLLVLKDRLPFELSADLLIADGLLR